MRGLPGRGVSVSTVPVSQCRIAGHGFGVLSSRSSSALWCQQVMVLRCDATVGGRRSLSTSTGGASGCEWSAGIGASFGRWTAPVACRCQSDPWLLGQMWSGSQVRRPSCSQSRRWLGSHRAPSSHPHPETRPWMQKTRHCAATADSRPPAEGKGKSRWNKSPRRPSLACFWFPSSCLLPSTCLDEPSGAVTLCNNDDFHKPTQRPISQNRDPFSRLRLRNQPIAPPKQTPQTTAKMASSPGAQQPVTPPPPPPTPLLPPPN